MSARLVKSNSSNGVLQSITLMLVDTEDIRIFDSLVNAVGPVVKCLIFQCDKSGQCAKTIDATGMERYITVDNPLSASVLPIGYASVVCPHRDTDTDIVIATLDYTSFPGVAAYVETLRKQYVKRLSEKGEK